MDIVKKNVVGVNDLVLLSKLSDEEVVRTLQIRYREDYIYTNIGPVLIAVNPFKLIAGIYTNAVIRKYKGRSTFELVPHVYSLTDQALRNLNSFRENQCIIITGESGSGKTETSKIVMQYIASSTAKSDEVNRVKEKMLASNPVLEAFGNAKTLRNDNSSRFGKYMKIEFNGRGDPIGGSISSYLLEKVRVIDPSLGERNFHIFYQICVGAQDHAREQFQIYGPEQYQYLLQSNCFEIDGTDDASNFSETFRAMHSLGATKSQSDSILSVVSAILWLGNVTFIDDQQEHSALEETETLSLVANLLQVDGHELMKALTTRTITTGTGSREEVFCKPLTAKDACITRDTLAKALYAKMFNYIVKLVNQSLSYGQERQTEIIHIGLLDIYGFEVFKNNSFEQLCINFVNERLQQIFIEQTLKAEQEEYQSEGIPWHTIEFFDNKPCCEVIEKKPGVFAILDDACNTSKGDAGFLSDISAFFSGNRFIWSSNSRHFTISHFAGNVSYTAQNFTAKNKDTLFDDLIECIQRSTASFVSDHEWDQIGITRGQKKKPPTVGMIFKTQVAELMAELGQCIPHYCRCIKPNETKRPNQFDLDYCRTQVRYLGLVENIRVRQAGYAAKLQYNVFVDRYAIINPTLWNHRRSGALKNKKQSTSSIMQHVKWTRGEEYAMGETKVFIRQAQSMFAIEKYRDTLLNRAALIIQRAFKRFANLRKSLENAYNCYEIFGGRKARRQASIDRVHKGDYINLCLNLEIRDLFRDEGILFADRVLDVTLKGKRGLMKRLKTALLKKPDLIRHPKFIALTNKSLFCLSMTPPSEISGSAPRMVVDWRLDLQSISAVIVSPFSDNIYIIESHSAIPVLQSCRRKTELIGLTIIQVRKITGISPPLQFAEHYRMQVLYKNVRSYIEIKFMTNPDWPTEEVMYLVNENVEVRVGPGIAGNVFPPPIKPKEIDHTIELRDRVEAIYDYTGNGVDELTINIGDVMYLIRDEGDGWMKAELNGKRGFIPATYVKVLPRNDRAKKVSAPAKTYQDLAPSRINLQSSRERTGSKPTMETGRDAGVAEGAARYSRAKIIQDERRIPDEERSGSQYEIKASGSSRARFGDKIQTIPSKKPPVVTFLEPDERDAGGTSRFIQRRQQHSVQAVSSLRTFEQDSSASSSAVSKPKPDAALKKQNYKPAVGVDKQRPLPSSPRAHFAKDQVLREAKASTDESSGPTSFVKETHAKQDSSRPVAMKSTKKPLPSTWQPYFDDSSNAYYWYNTETGESSWEKPTGI